MTDTLKAGRGRPRRFDTDHALAVGQQMFHARGYDAVGLAALTEALNIKPPSFYAAFGSKAGYFAQILERYAASVLTLDAVLLPGRSPAEALSDLLDRAARTYARDPARPGCLVLEAVRGGVDSESAKLALAVTERRRARIRAFVAITAPDHASLATDVVSSTMSGLSASAREGIEEARLVQIASVAAIGLRAMLSVK